MLSNHLILCHPLLLFSIFPSIRVFSDESALHIRWPKYCSFNFSISPSNEHSGLISFRIDWFDLLSVQGVGHIILTSPIGALLKTTAWLKGMSNIRNSRHHSRCQDENCVLACILFGNFLVLLFILPTNRMGFIYIKSTYNKLTTFEISLVKSSSPIQIRLIF